MEQRNQGIFLSVVGVATLLVAVLGATFAFFSIQVTGNDTASSINIRTAKVGGVTFIDGPAITLTNAYPGYTASKQFTIKSDTGVDATSQVQYVLQINTTNAALANAANNSLEFNYSLTGTSTNSGTVVTKPKTDMPKTTGVSDIGTGTLKGVDTHTYTFTVELAERSSVQNYLQGLSYVGILQVSVSDAQGLRTWDATNSTWKQYGS